MLIKKKIPAMLARGVKAPTRMANPNRNSAINWKGHYKNLIGIIVVDGDWTQATLQTMAKVFDYVVPLHQCPFMAKVLSRASNGDKTVLKWLMNFSISENPDYEKTPNKTLDTDT